MPSVRHCSSYNSACEESENQREKDPRLIHESRKTDIKNLNTNRYNQLGKSSAYGKKNECQGGDASEKLFYGLPLSVQSLIKKHKGIENLYDEL